MKYIGGYKMINFKNISLSDTAVTISGIYDSIENSYNKALMLCNVVIDDVEKNNVFSFPIAGNNEYTFNVNIGTITVNNDDEVTFIAAGE